MIKDIFFQITDIKKEKETEIELGLHFLEGKNNFENLSKIAMGFNGVLDNQMNNDNVSYS